MHQGGWRAKILNMATCPFSFQRQTEPWGDLITEENVIYKLTNEIQGYDNI